MACGPVAAGWGSAGCAFTAGTGCLGHGHDAVSGLAADEAMVVKVHGEASSRLTAKFVAAICAWPCHLRLIRANVMLGGKDANYSAKVFPQSDRASHRISERPDRPITM